MTLAAASLVWCLLQVTLFALLALVASWFARRSGPRAMASMIATALALLLVVTGLSFLPWPSMLRVPFARAAAPQPPTTARGDSASPMASFALSLLTADGSSPSAEPSLDADTGPAADARSLPTKSSFALLVWLVPLASIVAVGRWCHAVVSLRNYRRQSAPIDDPRLVAIARSLRGALQCPRGVELRATSAVAAPATIGWREPVVLLPIDWPTWSEGQLRAVLAHEFAHIARGDYAAWVAARFVQALHCYHPLVRWLVARMQLAQELAADALAAPLAGGREPYLQALAAIALADGNQPKAGHARAFLSRETDLLRRIAMLRDQDRRSDGGTRASGRQLTLVAMLVAGALFVLGLRPAPRVVLAAADSPPSAQGATSGAGVAIAQAEPSDELSLRLAGEPQLSANLNLSGPRGLSTTGNWLMKVSHPKAVVRAFVARTLKQHGLDSSSGLPLDDIASLWQAMQLAGGSRGPSQEPLTLLEFAATHDWNKVAEQAQWQADRQDEITVYHSGDSAWWFPDEQSVVIGSRNAVAAQVRDVATDSGTNWRGRVGLWAKRSNLLAMDSRSISEYIGSSPGNWPSILNDAVGTAWLAVWSSSSESPSGTEISLVYPNQTEAARSLPKIKNLLALCKREGVPPHLAALGFATAGEPRQEIDRVVLETQLPSTALSQGLNAANTAASRSEAMNHLKLIALAWHNYHDTYRAFPAPAMLSADGNPLLSWRVAILPFLDAKPLYEKFKLDEPWDSPHNLELLKEMPAVYGHPGTQTQFTSIVAPSGQHCMLHGPAGTKIQEIIDGTSNTIMLIETKTEIPWTKPEDFEVTADLSPETLTTYFEEGFVTAFGDGSAHFISKAVDKDLLQRLLTIDGREVVELPR